MILVIEDKEENYRRHFKAIEYCYKFLLHDNNFDETSYIMRFASFSQLEQWLDTDDGKKVLDEVQCVFLDHHLRDSDIGGRLAYDLLIERSNGALLGKFLGTNLYEQSYLNENNELAGIGVVPKISTPGEVAKDLLKILKPQLENKLPSIR